MALLRLRTAKAALRLTAASLLTALSVFAQQAPPVQAPSGGGVAAAEPTYRVFRSISGTKGSVKADRYIIEDPRTVFYIPEDKQVIVYFEWDGPLGQHRFEAYWKNPEGRVAVISDFSYEAKQKRFAGYWTLILSDTVPTGVWTLEARIDGESAGTHNFQILAAPKPAGMETPPPRIPLEQSELYKRAVAAGVTIERMNVRGEKVGFGAGFLLGENIVLTAFQVIDGASSLRITLPGGAKVETLEVLNWHRRQDWALLQVPTGTAPALPPAKPGSWSVGDRTYSLNTAAVGNWILVPMDIIGANQVSGAGERVNVTGGAAVGAPLLDEYGDVIGVMGGSLLPGMTSLTSGGVILGYSTAALLRDSFRGELAVPLTQISLAQARRGTLDGLLKSGESTPLLEAHHNVMAGSLSRDVDRRGGMPNPLDEKYEYSTRDAQCNVLLVLRPLEKRDTMVTLRVFDIDNRSLGTSKPSKLKLRKNEVMSVDWKLPIAGLKPGLYRVDVYFGEQPAWRTYFRIIE